MSELFATLSTLARETVSAIFSPTHVIAQDLGLFSAFETQFTMNHKRLTAFNGRFSK